MVILDVNLHDAWHQCENRLRQGRGFCGPRVPGFSPGVHFQDMVHFTSNTHWISHTDMCTTGFGHTTQQRVKTSLFLHLNGFVWTFCFSLARLRARAWVRQSDEAELGGWLGHHPTRPRADQGSLFVLKAGSWLTRVRGPPFPQGVRMRFVVAWPCRAMETVHNVYRTHPCITRTFLPQIEHQKWVCVFGYEFSLC